MAGGSMLSSFVAIGADDFGISILGGQLVSQISLVFLSAFCLY
jgi:hypothetical protein